MKRLGHISSIMTFVINVDFDLFADQDKLKEMIKLIETVEGVAKTEIKRYSIDVETGYLFDLDTVRKDVIKVIRKLYKPEEVFEITLKDVLEKRNKSNVRPQEEEHDVEEVFKRLGNLVGEA